MRFRSGLLVDIQGSIIRVYTDLEPHSRRTQPQSPLSDSAVELVKHTLWKCSDCNIAESIPQILLDGVQAFKCSDWEGVNVLNDGMDAGEGDVCDVRGYRGSRCVRILACGKGGPRRRGRAGDRRKGDLRHSVVRRGGRGDIVVVVVYWRCWVINTGRVVLRVHGITLILCVGVLVSGEKEVDIHSLRRFVSC